MAKRKPTPLAAALLAVDQLSPEEITTLSDYLRSKTATPRKKAVKKEQQTLAEVGAQRGSSAA